MTDKAYAVPLHEQLANVPRNARLVIDDADGRGTSFIPVGRMCHEAAEALRARLAQPEKKWVGLTGEELQAIYQEAGTVHFKFAMVEAMTKDNIQRMKNVLEQQGQKGTWDYDPYMHGMYNGMELMMALAEGRDPDYREAPEEWLGTQEKYRELLYAVASVFPNETRHQTALRYIKNAESHTDMKEKKEESNG